MTRASASAREKRRLRPGPAREPAGHAAVAPPAGTAVLLMHDDRVRVLFVPDGGGAPTALGLARHKSDAFDAAVPPTELAARAAALVGEHRYRDLIVVPPPAWLHSLALRPGTPYGGLSGLRRVQQLVLRHFDIDPADLAIDIMPVSIDGTVHPVVTTAAASRIHALIAALRAARMVPSAIRGVTVAACSRLLAPGTLACLVRRDDLSIAWLGDTGELQLRDLARRLPPDLTRRARVIGAALIELMAREPELAASTRQIELLGALGNDPAGLSAQLAKRLSLRVLVSAVDGGVDGGVEAAALAAMRSREVGVGFATGLRPRPLGARLAAAAAAVALVLCGLAGSHLLAERIADSTRAMRRDIERTARRGEAGTRRIDAPIRVRVERYEQRKQTLEALSRSRVDVIDVLAEVSASLPPDVHLLRLTLDDPLEGAPRLTLRGQMSGERADAAASIRLRGVAGRIADRVGGIDIVRELLQPVADELRPFDIELALARPQD